MKIVFLCGSLESGRDGVGDYTIRLATELTRNGHKIGVLAFNDQYVKHEVEQINQINGTAGLPLLRLPFSFPSNKRIHRAKDWIENFNPDWISLQFVIFSFHPKGLPFGLSRQLLELGGKRRWHIMFHELWVGMDMNASTKNIIWGRVQKYLIKKLVLVLNPGLIHTQSRLFQRQLSRLGFETGYLPLFGNIPYAIRNNSEKKEDHSKSKKIIRLVLFALIHAGAPIVEFAREVARYSMDFDTRISLTILGRSGPEQKKWIAAFKAENLLVESLGEQTPEYISMVLSYSTLGISTTPIVLADKSGSIAAMREHGLPVLCVSYLWLASKNISFEPIPGIFQYRNGNFVESIASTNKYSVSSNLESTAIELAIGLSGYKYELLNK